MSSQQHRNGHNGNGHNGNGHTTGAALSLDDVYFTAFRHKRLILTCLFLGLAGALIVRLVVKPVYASETKLLMKYVVRQIEVNPGMITEGTTVVPTDKAGGNIINSEAAILMSRDLAIDVAKEVGPEKLLEPYGGGTNIMKAAGVVAAGLATYSPAYSDVLTVSFTHPDPSVVQPVLSALVPAYLSKHIKAQSGTAFSEEYYLAKVDEVRRRMLQTDEKLKDLLKKAGELDPAKAQLAYAEQVGALRRDLLKARSDYEAQRILLSPRGASSGSTTAPVPSENIDEYATVVVGLRDLSKTERELRVTLTPSHPRVTAVQEQIETLKKRKLELEKEYPGLVDLGTVPLVDDPIKQRSELQKLEAQVQALECTLSNVQAQGFNLMSVQPQIDELNREHELETKQYQYLLSLIDQIRTDEGGGNKVTGINTIELPTPPIPIYKKVSKLMLMVFVGFTGFGIGMSVLIDYVIDRTIKRSADVRRHTKLPFFLSIPHTVRNGHTRLKLPFFKASNGEANANGEKGAVSHIVPPWDFSHHLRVYAEGLRERLITYFEVNGMNHKPKLVGVTSCSKGAGATTLASGLAVALSKTGDGNVLLVDMHGPSTTHSFYKGKPGCGIADVLNPDSRAEAQIQENLYLASLDSSSKGADDYEEVTHKLLPSRFNKIMPQLKTSDYDYIIFDMPPVTPTSATPRLASHMDVALLVFEAEKTTQHAAAQAGMLLSEARANTAVVLNKCRQHVPAMLSSEM